MPPSTRPPAAAGSTARADSPRCAVTRPEWSRPRRPKTRRQHGGYGTYRSSSPASPGTCRPPRRPKASPCGLVNDCQAARAGGHDGGAVRAVWAGVIAGLREQITGADFAAGWEGLRRVPAPITRPSFRAAAFAAGWEVLSIVPAPITSRSFRAATDTATARGGPAARQLRMNLGRVAGPARTDEQMDALVRDAMRSYARYWLETFRLPKMDRPAVAARAGSQTFGTEHLDAAVQAGRGFILALPHTGNYDVAGLWLIERYHRPFTTVAERLRPASLFDRFVAYRQSIGMEVLALTGGEQPLTAVLRERLKAGGGVCLVADRDLSQHGVEVDFFGERARMPSGPALLGPATRAAALAGGG